MNNNDFVIKTLRAKLIEKIFDSAALIINDKLTKEDIEFSFDYAKITCIDIFERYKNQPVCDKNLSIFTNKNINKQTKTARKINFK